MAQPSKARILVSAAALLVLAGAGIGGAVIEDRIITVERGEWIRLGPTRIYCEAYFNKSYESTAFDCGFWQGSHRVPNSYSAVIDELGVEIDKWDATGRKHREIVTYGNP